MEETKLCKCCKEKKALSFFSVRSDHKHLLRSWCKDCSNKSHRDRRKNMSLKEKKQYRKHNAELFRLWRKNNPYYAEKNNGIGVYRYGRSKFAAKRRKCTWELTKEEYYKLIQQKCAYCGSDIETKGVGLDKINPSIKKYCLSNVTPCCKKCNWIKNNYFTYEEMKKIGELIKTFPKR